MAGNGAVAAGGRPKIVLLGMMTKMPVAGVVWQTLHYLLGLERLGCEAYYVETHARTPSMLMSDEDDDSSALAAEFIAAVMRRFGLADRWAFHALHDDGRCFGMSEHQLDRLYGSAELLINLHGGTQPLPELSANGRLDLPRDRSGPAAARAPPRRAGDGRLPRAALRLLHLRRELGQARLRPAGAGALPVHPHPPAGRARPLARSLAAARRRLHHDRQLAPGLARRHLRRRALHLEQAPRVPQVPRAARAQRPGLRAGAEQLPSGGAADAGRARLARARRPRGLARDRQLPRLHRRLARRVHRRQGPERPPAHRLVQRPQRHLPGRRPAGLTQDTGFGTALPDRRGPARLRLARGRGSRRVGGDRRRLLAPRPRRRARSPASTSATRSCWGRCWSSSASRTRKPAAARRLLDGLPARDGAGAGLAAADACCRGRRSRPRRRGRRRPLRGRAGARRRQRQHRRRHPRRPRLQPALPRERARQHGRARLRADRRRQRLDRRHPGLPDRPGRARRPRARPAQRAQRRLRPRLQPGPRPRRRRASGAAQQRHDGAAGLARAAARATCATPASAWSGR